MLHTGRIVEEYLAQVGIELDNKLFVRELVVDLIVFERPVSERTL